VRQTAARIINVALSFLGIISVIIVLVGGFKYMISGGNEEKTSEAKNLIVSGIIGLAIILSAWGYHTIRDYEFVDSNDGRIIRRLVRANLWASDKRELRKKDPHRTAILRQGFEWSLVALREEGCASGSFFLQLIVSHLAQRLDGGLQ
jgi:hypothetical protein